MTSFSTAPSRVAENSMRCSPSGREVEDLRDRRHEAEVGHVVGLVEDVMAMRSRRQRATLDQVDQPARGGDDDVDATLERLDLATDRRTAVDRGDPQAEGLGQRVERVGDLLGKLAGRDEDQAARAAGQRARRRRGGPASAGRSPASCRSRSGRGRARRGRRGRPAGCGSGWRTAPRCRRGRARGRARPGGRARRRSCPQRRAALSAAAVRARSSSLMRGAGAGRDEDCRLRLRVGPATAGGTAAATACGGTAAAGGAGPEE